MEELIFQVPGFVKAASAADLDINSPEAVRVGDMRIDTKASAWYAGANIRKKAMAGESVNPYYKQQVDQACQLFNISDKDYQLNPVACDHVVVKTASHTAEFFITDANKLKESADVLLMKRGMIGNLRLNGYVGPAEGETENRRLQSVGFDSIRRKNEVCRFFMAMWKKDRALPAEAPRAYSGSAPCLFWKRLALISEAQGA